MAGKDALTLDEAQRAVVDHGPGPLLALGGPGTGKTTALVERYVRLATTEGCSPDRILFLVPNRAQKIGLQDLLTRRLLFGGSGGVGGLGRRPPGGPKDEDTGKTGELAEGPEYEGLEALIEVPVYTWHGLAHHLVGRHYDRLGYSEPPVLLTSPEQWGDVRDALAAENEANWPHHRHLLRNRGFVDEVVDFCIRAEQRLLDDGQLDALAAARPAWSDIVRFFKTHRTRLRARSRIDYPTLLADATDLVANEEYGVRDALHRRFLHVLVDDGQELALVQQRMLHFLTTFTTGTIGGRSLVLAGDPDSAIETFRGAEPDWLDDFAKEFGDYSTATLDRCYRLGEGLGRPALKMIERNGTAEHRPREFVGGAELEVRRFGNLAAEVDAIARYLRLAHLTEHIPYEDMAILLTSPRAMLPALERALDAVEVPFSVSAPDRPLAREPVVRAFSALAQFAYEPEPEAEELLELLRSPLIDLDDAVVRELERIARVSGTPLAQLVQDPPAELGPDAAAKLRELLELRNALNSKKDAPADVAFWVVWDRSRFCTQLQERARASLDDPANRDLDALVAFSRALGRFVERRHGEGTFKDYLDAIGRADFGSDPWLPPERAGGGVNVVSFHGAKGKEWAIVAVAGVVEGAIPKGRRATGLFDPYFLDETDAAARARRNEAEDRRVFYVAVTRASKRCLVTTSPGPSRRGEPSRFIEELVDEVPEIAPAQDLPPLTFAEAAARYRRVLADMTRPVAERIAALAAVTETCRLDPNCSAAQPSEWWWRWDWTEQPLTIREQQAESDEDLPLDRLRTSYSRISTYDNCGLQYLYAVVLGLDPESSHNMAFGSWIHKVFEELETGAIPLTPQAAYARYDELFDESVFPNKAVARQFKREGQVMIERYGKYLKPGKAAVAETTFRVDLEGHRITGRIDRVDAVGRNLVISDYKTSKSAITWDEARESLQLAIYYLAARSDEKLSALGEPVAMQLIYPNAPLSRGDVAKRAQKPEEAEAALARLPELIEGVLKEDFRPDPEADCKWCRFKPICPLWSEGKELPA